MIYYTEPNTTLYQGHVLDVLKELPPESVDCCITSPPYWGLRSYKTEPIVWGNGHCEHEWDDGIPRAGYRSNDSNPGHLQSIATQNRNETTTNFCLRCHAWRGELGLEPTIELYISHLIQIFDECKRVLKKSGTLFVNLADSYSNSGGAHLPTHKNPGISKSASRNGVQREWPDNLVPAKSLCLIPERFVIGMVEHGWICRNDIIWYKANPMPESVKDRFTGTYEHVYFFVKSKKYWFEQQFEPILQQSLERLQRNHFTDYDPNYPNQQPQKLHKGERLTKEQAEQINGRNKRDVWEINTQPYPEAHFATFPEDLVTTPILAGCPSMICKKCGKAREPIYVRKPMVIKKTEGYAEASGNRTATAGTMLEPAEATLKGYSDCGCGAGWAPGTVMDIFAGSGTTLAVAKKLNRKSIGIELNPNYCKLCVQRLSEIPIPMELAC